MIFQRSFSVRVGNLPEGFSLTVRFILRAFFRSHGSLQGTAAVDVPYVFPPPLEIFLLGSLL